MASLDIAKLKTLEPAVVCLGSHPGIIQSIMDFDYLQGRAKPSIKAIIASGRNNERYFFGKNEVLVPVYESPEEIPVELRDQLNLFLNLVSGRRVLSSTKQLLETMPNMVGGTVFAERVPERHALELYELAGQKQVWIAGGASVGLMISNHSKLGAIGGTQAAQLTDSNLFAEGQIAVVSSSGGMVNEIIRQAANSGYGLSFALAVGGERFPMTTPREVLLAAEQDPGTKAVAYFGELGGTDEYELVDLIKSGQLTKPVVAYIAGTVAELFETPPQFGHAKAMASNQLETASAKREALRQAGAQAADSFAQFIEQIHMLNLTKVEHMDKPVSELNDRQKGLITSSVSYDVDGDVKLLGKDLLDLVENNSFASLTASMLLGKQVQSKETAEFVDFVLRLSVDHGPYVSGAMNTIVTARAGRDLVSALTAGLLTIGPRFGGAINQAAGTWLKGVKDGIKPADLVEDFASRKQYISGIGHKKYRIDNPDPRVAAILKLTEGLEKRQFTKFAQAIEAETVQKKGNLILNVDGAIAAGLLDILREKEGYDIKALEQLVDVEFFNALFVLSRSVGFMAHYFDQRRIDEGLFRLGDNHVTKLEQ
jgi:ATP citrate (pro-S)-lyase